MIIILNIVIIGLTGMIGTGLGGLISILIPKTSNKFLCSVLEFASGLMLCVVFLDLIPSAIAQTNIYKTAIGIIIGVLFMDLLSQFTKTSSLMHLGKIMAFGIALHNLPEGLALGVALDFDETLAYTLMLAIFTHDIPEGLAFSIPLKASGMKKLKILVISIITGLATGVGGVIGVLIGEVSNEMITLSLGLASGAMLYIILNDILPESKRMYKGRTPFLFNIIGIVMGLIISSV